MEALVERLEAEAAEKTARAAEKAANDPLVLANAGLSKLWQRAHRAQQKVAEAQAKLGSSLHGSFSFRHELTDLKMLSPPPEWFETPADIGGGPPRAMGLEEADLLAADLSVAGDRNDARFDQRQQEDGRYGARGTQFRHRHRYVQLERVVPVGTRLSSNQC